MCVYFPTAMLQLWLLLYPTCAQLYALSMIRFNYIYIAEKLFKWNTLKLKSMPNDEQKSWISQQQVENCFCFSGRFMLLRGNSYFYSSFFRCSRSSTRVHYYYALYNHEQSHSNVMLPFMNMHCLMKMGFLAFN